MSSIVEEGGAAVEVDEAVKPVKARRFVGKGKQSGGKGSRVIAKRKICWPKCIIPPVVSGHSTRRCLQLVGAACSFPALTTIHVAKPISETLLVHIRDSCSPST
jgi:hypothetical protein